MAMPTAMHLQLMGRIMASADEIASNPRARSAVMRVAERTEAA
jgi:16S rRNA (cytosine1402-N4)-methyltransferase